MKNDMLVLQDVVEKTLRSSQQARDNNYVLIWGVYKQYGVEPRETFASVTLKLIDKKLPPLESVLRARRKVVELYPELDASANIKALRKQAEEEYKEYARQ